MSESQYWDGDPELVKYFRKADLLSVERQNFQAWLHGRYIYDALCAVSPVLHAFAKKGTKPAKYTEKPYPLTESEIEKAKEDKAKFSYDKNKALMKAFMERTNKRLKGGETNADND